MIEHLLTEIEQIDRLVAEAEGTDVVGISRLLERRAAAIAGLSRAASNGEIGLVHRLDEVARSTARMRERFGFLRENTVEDMGLLKRHDRLLQAMTGNGGNPCYVDYSG